MALLPNVCRAWQLGAFGLVGLLAIVATPGASDRSAAAQDPLAPTGRAVCSTAFTAVAVLGFGNFVVPPGAPLGPNDVITALRPILELCVDTFPPQPPVRCVTADLIPATPLPISPPDVGGLLAEQTQALVDAIGGPVAAALSGPLRSLFFDGLGCQEPVVDDGAVPEVPPLVESPATTNPETPPPIASVAPAPALVLGGSVAVAPGPLGEVVDDVPFRSVPVLRSLVASPLRGAGTVAAAGVLLLLGVVLSRQLAPRRAASLDRATARRR